MLPLLRRSRTCCSSCGHRRIDLVSKVHGAVLNSAIMREASSTVTSPFSWPAVPALKVPAAALGSGRSAMKRLTSAETDAMSPTR